VPDQFLIAAFPVPIGIDERISMEGSVEGTSQRVRGEVTLKPSVEPPVVVALLPM
jgi:hypothetical protein